MGIKEVSEIPTKKDSDSSSHIDPSSVMVVGAVDDQGMLQFTDSSSHDKKKKKTASEDKVESQTVKHTKSSLEKPSQVV